MYIKFKNIKFLYIFYCFLYTCFPNVLSRSITISKKYKNYILKPPSIIKFKNYSNILLNADNLLFINPPVCRYKIKSVYSNKKDKILEKKHHKNDILSKGLSVLLKTKKKILNVIYPSGVTDNYYQYANWRLLERFSHSMSQSITHNSMAHTGHPVLSLVSSNLGIIPVKKIDHITTTLMSQISREILTRIVKTMWVGNIGIGFDMNPRAFCFWGSIMCTLTNLVDFISSIFPTSYSRIIKNCTTLSRQIGMLTTAASIGPIYGSFRSNMNVSNIGEITAKMEAITPLCELFGSATGSILCHFLQPYKPLYHAIAFCASSLLANYSSFCAVQMVVFRSLNISRCFSVLEDFSTALLKRLDRYLVYHKLKKSLKKPMTQLHEDKFNEYDYDEGGEIAGMIFKREFNKANEMLQRFTQSHMCNTLRASRTTETKPLIADTNEPQNLVQKRISTQLLTPADIAKMEPFLIPGAYGVLPYGAIKKHIRYMNIDYLTLHRYLRIFKKEKFVVVITPHADVEAVIYKKAKPRDAVLAILTYNIADKLWSIFSDIVDDNTSDLRELWNFCKLSARRLFALGRGSEKSMNKNVKFCDSLEVKQGLSIVSYAFTMAKACIDELMLSLESAKWDIDKFDLTNLKK